MGKSDKKIHRSNKKALDGFNKKKFEMDWNCFSFYGYFINVS